MATKKSSTSSKKPTVKKIEKKPEVKENEVEKPVPTSKVIVKVTSEGVEDTVYEESHPNDTSKITVPVSGVGNITVKVYVGEVLKGTKSIDLNSSDTSVTFE